MELAVVPSSNTDLAAVQAKLAAKAKTEADVEVLPEEGPANLPTAYESSIVKLLPDAEVGFGVGHDYQTLAITAGHVAPMVKPEEKDRNDKVALMYKRAKEADSQCLGLMSYVPSAKDLAAAIGLAHEKVIMNLQVAGFIGGPEQMDGKVGDGVLVITELNGHKRLHFLMNEFSASMESNEFFTETLKDRKEKFPDGAFNNSYFYDMRARYTFKSEHSVEGGYMVDGTYVEFYASEAKWQDVGKVSKLFTGSQYENKAESTDGPKEPAALSPVEEVGGGGCCGCCGGSKPKPKPPPPKKEEVKKGEYSLTEKNTVKGDNVTNKDEITAALEKYLTQYAEALTEDRGLHPTQYTDSVDGETTTAMYLKKLHTVELKYTMYDEKTEDSEPEDRTMTIVCNPFKSPFEDIINFTNLIQGFVIDNITKEEEEKKKKEAEEKAEALAAEQKEQDALDAQIQAVEQQMEMKLKYMKAKAEIMKAAQGKMTDDEEPGESVEAMSKTLAELLMMRATGGPSVSATEVASAAGKAGKGKKK